MSGDGGMKRSIEEKLLEWKNKRDRKPLILNGARIVPLYAAFCI